MKENEIIVCDDVTKIYKQGDENIYAVRDCFFSVRQGDFTMITGTSGCGKSTLLHLLAAFETPSAGTILFNSNNVEKFSERQKASFRNKNIGFIFQNYQLIPFLTAKENILLPTKGRGGTADLSYYRRLISILELGDQENHLPGELSGGQQQRVAIARALINRPDVVLADEPTGNLDQASSINIMELFAEAQKNLSLTIIMVTHNAGLINYANAVYTMSDGYIRKEHN